MQVEANTNPSLTSHHNICYISVLDRMLGCLYVCGMLDSFVWVRLDFLHTHRGTGYIASSQFVSYLIELSGSPNNEDKTIPFIQPFYCFCKGKEEFL